MCTNYGFDLKILFSLHQAHVHIYLQLIGVTEKFILINIREKGRGYRGWLRDSYAVPDYSIGFQLLTEIAG